jgi:hypothetical protein
MRRWMISRSDRRRHVFEALPVRDQLESAADSVQLTLQIADAPAVIR